MAYTTTDLYSDGFGAQYQKILMCFFSSKIHHLTFHYRPFDKMEHNYKNDPDFIRKKEELINLKNNIPNVQTSKYSYVDTHYKHHFETFEKNIDMCCESEHMKFIKQCFWSNKDRDFFKNGKINVAVHIRRLNSHDGGPRNAGARVTTENSYYLNIVNLIRTKYKENLLFHIYSQGTPNNFTEFSNQTDIILHLDTDVDNSFIGMVAADILVTSPSSLSYVAGILNDGEVWYKPFWHPPRKAWIIC